MSSDLRWEQCCDEPGCKAPARYGSLCVRCCLAATPARRAVEMASDSPAMGNWDAAFAAELLPGA